MSNPRYQNGALRRKNRARFKAMGLPCAICGKPIRYDEPSDSKHPFSFVIDEIMPVSKWQQAGYNSARAAAEDFNNLQPCHYICNQLKSDKVGFKLANVGIVKKVVPDVHNIPLDGKW